MKKILSAGILIGITTISGVFANDCNLVSSKDFNKNIDTIGKTTQVSKYNKVIPSDALKKAMINLRSYCCDQKIIPCEEKGIIPYPESSYLFDHLLDVTMRRLDGVPSLAYNLEVDPAALDRRTKSTVIANNTEGAQSLTIDTLYKEYWTIHKKETKNLEIVAENYSGKNSATLSLGDKYNTLCRLMKNIYENIQKNGTIIGDEFESNSFFSKCENLVENRVDKESSYIRLLMIKKSTQLLDQTTKAYTKKYFVEEKLMALWTLVGKVKDMFQTIVQQAAASKTCSK